MSETNWNDLARRCKTAEGENLDLDYRITRAAFPDDILPVANVTSSLDAITAMIERKLPGLGWEVARWEDDPGTPYARLMWNEGDTFKSTKEVRAATPALALCAAFCKAMVHWSTPHE